jgi:phosphate transport system substrate-binding protein
MEKRVSLPLAVGAGLILAAAVALPRVAAGGFLGRAQADNLSGKLVIAGSTSVQPLAEELAQEFMSRNPRVRVQVQGGGSSAGITAAKGGAADIGTSSRELKPEEKGLHEVKIALDGIAVVVHPTNPVTNLTSEQVRKIFSGELTNWKQLGGPAKPIMLVTREAGSGTRGAFEELLLAKKSVVSSAIVQGSTGAVASSVAQAPDAIGYVSIGALDKTIKAVSLDGVKATEANVRNKTYKLARPFLFLTKGQPSGLAKAFIDYVLGAGGQKIVAGEFVPVK